MSSDTLPTGGAAGVMSNPPDVAPPRWFSTFHVLLRHVGAIAAIVLFPLNDALLALFLGSYLARMWGMEPSTIAISPIGASKPAAGFSFCWRWLGCNVVNVAPLWWAYVQNTLGHLPRVGAYQRYRVEPYSVNRPLLSFLMLGAAFHNNHHRFASSARSGLEVDTVYWSLRLLRASGLISNLRDEVPKAVLREGGIGT